jgi:hypothetical protein
VAWNTNPTVSIILFFKDDDNAESKHTISVPLSALSGASAWARAYADLLISVSNCALWKIRITSTFKDDGAQISMSGSNAKRQSVFIFETEEGQNYVVSVPGLIYSRLVQVGPYTQIQLDPTDTAISSFVSMMVNGNGTSRPVAPWNAADGGVNEWEWAGVPLLRLKTAYWGFERPGWK